MPFGASTRRQKIFCRCGRKSRYCTDSGMVTDIVAAAFDALVAVTVTM